MSAMRAPITESPGTAGQSFVKSQFEEMGWGPLPNPEHDLGTDLWLMVRDARRFDLRSLVGAQVKSGPSYFSEPEVENGVVKGWWYRDDKDHFEYWTEHKVPHLIILHDNGKKVSYWTHVTSEKVVSTGKGSKIFVPIDSVVDDEKLDELLAIATSSPHIKEWEGSVWQLGHAVPSSSELRYGLITPRLIAPHGNNSVDELTAAQAIALLVQMRIREIGAHQEKQSLLDPVAAKKSDDIVWRLYGGLYQWVVNGDIDQLLALDAGGEAPSFRAALTACVANALFDEGRPDEALPIVESLLAEDVVNPVDDGWLRSHRMRCLVDLGNLQEAQDEATRVHALRNVTPDDPTARALAGVGSFVVLNTGGFFDQLTIAEAVQSSDNLASWWRSQTFVAALEKQTEESFKAWGDDTSVTIGADDVVGHRLLSTMLIAGFMADSSAWKSSAKLLCQHRLMTDGTDQSITTACLRRLVRIGADKEVQLAVRRLLGFGPVASVSDAVRAVDMSKLTRLSLKSILVLQRSAADVMSEASCDKFTVWALNELTGRSSAAADLQPQFLVTAEIISTLSVVVRGCSESVRRDVMVYILNLPPVPDQMAAHEYAGLIAQIDAKLWSEDDVTQLSSRGDGDNFELREALEKLVATRNPEFRNSLIVRIKAGDFAALVSFGTIKDLPVDAAAGMIARLAERVATQTADARRGAYSVGTQDPLNALVLLNSLFPEEAQWGPCVEAVAEERSNGNDIAGGLRALGLHADKVPASVRDSLRGSLARLAKMVPGAGFTLWAGGRSDTRGAAVLAASRLFPEEFSNADLVQLVQGGAGQRSAAVQVIGAAEDSNNLALLSVLATDPDLNVRRAAAYFLARWVLKGVGSVDTVEVLRGLIQKSGVRVATAASDALLDSREQGDEAPTLIKLLNDCPSVYVRERVAEAQVT